MKEQNNTFLNNCNIVKDLLPLYLEELCSEDSKSYVEAHLAQCEDCQSSCALLKSGSLTADAAEAQEINALRKLKAHIVNQKLSGYLLFLAVLGIGIFTLLITASTNRLYYVCYALLTPLTILATDFTFRSKTAPSAPKSDRALLIPQSLLLLFDVCIMFYVIFALYLDPQSTPLGIPLVQTGPLLSALFRLTVLLSLMIFAVGLYQVIQKKIRYGMLPNVSILCIFLNLTYLSMLYGMSSLERLSAELLRNTLLLCGICALLSIVMSLWRRRGRDAIGEAF